MNIRIMKIDDYMDPRGHVLPDKEQQIWEAGAIKVLTVNGKKCLDYSYTAIGNAAIEAGYSSIVNEPTGAAGTRRKKNFTGQESIA